MREASHPARRTSVGVGLPPIACIDFVVDSSALVDVFLARGTAPALRRSVLAGACAAPELLDLESASVRELRDAVTSYDASYLALAEMLGVPLLTLDARLSRSSGHDAEVVVYGSS